MRINLKRYLTLLVATTLYLVVGFFIDYERFVWWVANGLFWLLVSVLQDLVSNRRSINQQTEVR